MVSIYGEWIQLYSRSRLVEIVLKDKTLKTFVNCLISC